MSQGLRKDKENLIPQRGVHGLVGGVDMHANNYITTSLVHSIWRWNHLTLLERWGMVSCREGDIIILLMKHKGMKREEKQETALECRMHKKVMGDETRKLLRDHIRKGLVFHQDSELDPIVDRVLVKAPGFTYA